MRRAWMHKWRGRHDSMDGGGKPRREQAADDAGSARSRRPQGVQSHLHIPVRRPLLRIHALAALAHPCAAAALAHPCARGTCTSLCGGRSCASMRSRHLHIPVRRRLDWPQYGSVGRPTIRSSPQRKLESVWTFLCKSRATWIRALLALRARPSGRIRCSGVARLVAGMTTWKPEARSRHGSPRACGPRDDVGRTCRRIATPPNRHCERAARSNPDTRCRTQREALPR